MLIEVINFLIYYSRVVTQSESFDHKLTPRSSIVCIPGLEIIYSKVFYKL